MSETLREGPEREIETELYFYENSNGLVDTIDNELSFNPSLRGNIWSAIFAAFNINLVFFAKFRLNDDKSEQKRIFGSFPQEMVLGVEIFGSFEFKKTLALGCVSLNRRMKAFRFSVRCTLAADALQKNIKSGFLLRPGKKFPKHGWLKYSDENW